MILIPASIKDLRSHVCTNSELGSVSWEDIRHSGLHLTNREQRMHTLQRSRSLRVLLLFSGPRMFWRQRQLDTCFSGAGVRCFYSFGSSSLLPLLVQQTTPACPYSTGRVYLASCQIVYHWQPRVQDSRRALLPCRAAGGGPCFPKP